ncbi:NAD(P)-binding protein [Dentipellis sp. KUC8613]|nr:NAD(P)-binding protein [Dentipellis sp. KUC8613]
MVYALCKRLYKVFYPPAPSVPSASPLKIGILGAANIAPIALILPAKNHPDAVVHAVAARDQARADAFAKKWGIGKAYGGAGAYQKLLDDPEIEAIYNPLPNGLHYEWTMKALLAGKHVLLEKPSADTAEETRKMFELAEKKGLVLLEAFHYRFHPAAQRAKEIVASGEIGDITSIEVSLQVPRGIIGDGDIRLKHELGGGAFMDMGCYTMSAARYLAGADPVKVTSATADTASKFPKIDLGTTAVLAFPSKPAGVSETSEADSQSTYPVTLKTHFRLSPRLGFIPAMPQVYAKVVGTRGEVKLFNFAGPYIYHYITVKRTNEKGKVVSSRTEKRYGEGEKNGWSTYRFQLEAFVDKVRGRTPQHWFDGADSIANLTWIEHVYEATDLGVRPASTAEIPGVI